jgi:hypothetical protein
MGSNRIEFMQTDPFIFMEIAGQHDRGGADVSVIREGVDYRQKMLLSDSELRDSLKRLQFANLIYKRGDKFFISESVVASLPRTASGQLSFRRQDWDKLRKRLFEK